MSTSQVGNLVSSPSPTVGAGLTAGQYDDLVGASALSSATMTQTKVEVLAKKATIKVPDTPGSTFAVVTVMPDGTISGEPGVLHYTNGHMFNISDNWYLEG